MNALEGAVLDLAEDEETLGGFGVVRDLVFVPDRVSGVEVTRAVLLGGGFLRREIATLCSVRVNGLVRIRPDDGSARVGGLAPRKRGRVDALRVDG